MCIEVYWNAQGLLCGVLQVIVQKLSETESTKASVIQYADAIMEVLLQVIPPLLRPLLHPPVLHTLGRIHSVEHFSSYHLRLYGQHEG